MPLLYMVIFMVSTALITYTTLALDPTHKTIREVGSFNPNLPAGGQLTNKVEYYDADIYNGPSEEELQIETLYYAETALMRTCRVIATLSKENNCATPRNESTVWVFLGGLGTNGRLQDILVPETGTQPTFSCAGIQAFGRQLLSNSLPLEFAQNGGTPIRYNLSGMVDIDDTDPCGYADVVSL